MKLKIKYMRVNKDLDHLVVNPKGEWIDLRLANDIHLSEGEFALLSLGIRVKIPEGFEAYIVPRSSTFKNFGILQANSIGIIDSSYCGPNDIWKMPAFAIRAVGLIGGTRICQFKIMPSQFATKEQKDHWLTCDGIELMEEEWLDGSEESRGGFGSTGVN